MLYFKCVWTHTPWCTLWKLGDICDVSTLFLPLGSFGDLTTDLQVYMPSLPAQPSGQQGSGVFKDVKKHTDFEAQHSRLHSVTHRSLRSLQTYPEVSTFGRFLLTTPSFTGVTPEQIRNNQFGDSPNYIKRPTGKKGGEKKRERKGEQKERGREGWRNQCHRAVTLLDAQILSHGHLSCLACTNHLDKPSLLGKHPSSIRMWLAWNLTCWSIGTGRGFLESKQKATSETLSQSNILKWKLLGKTEFRKTPQWTDGTWQISEIASPHKRVQPHLDMWLTPRPLCDAALHRVKSPYSPQKMQKEKTWNASGAMYLSENLQNYIQSTKIHCRCIFLVFFRHNWLIRHNL